MKVFEARILQCSVRDGVKDLVVRLGLQIAEGSDIFIDCDDLEERGIEVEDSELKAIIEKASTENCHYIHLF